MEIRCYGEWSRAGAEFLEVWTAAGTLLQNVRVLAQTVEKDFFCGIWKRVVGVASPPHYALYIIFFSTFAVSIIQTIN